MASARLLLLQHMSSSACIPARCEASSPLGRIHFACLLVDCNCFSLYLLCWLVKELQP